VPRGSRLRATTARCPKRDQPRAHRPGGRPPYTTERSAAATCSAEGWAAERIVFTGNVMIDSLLACPKQRVRPPPPCRRMAWTGAAVPPAGLTGGHRLHRPSNVDDAAALRRCSRSWPRWRRSCRWCSQCTRARATTSNVSASAPAAPEHVAVLPPQGYLEMVGLMDGATLVLTDFRGLQEETTALGVPCLTLRENTERPITVEQGTKHHGRARRSGHPQRRGRDPGRRGKRGRVPELWTAALPSVLPPTCTPGCGRAPPETGGWQRVDPCASAHSCGARHTRRYPGRLPSWSAPRALRADEDAPPHMLAPAITTH